MLTFLVFHSVAILSASVGYSAKSKVSDVEYKIKSHNWKCKQLEKKQWI
jgi:hypothetical protein